MTREWTPVEVQPLVDNQEQRQWWQPIVSALSDWEPKVGDRVRVRLSGECQQDGYAGSLKQNILVSHVGHYPSEEGVTGTVVVCAYIERDGFCIEESHRVVIKFDTAFKDMVPGVAIQRGHYAACELELLP